MPSCIGECCLVCVLVDAYRAHPALFVGAEEGTSDGSMERCAMDASVAMTTSGWPTTSPTVIGARAVV